MTANIEPGLNLPIPSWGKICFMKNFAGKFHDSINRGIATLILHRGLIGTAAQLVIHTLTFAIGRERRQRAWAGIRRAVLM